MRVGPRALGLGLAILAACRFDTSGVERDAGPAVADAGPADARLADALPAIDAPLCDPVAQTGCLPGMACRIDYVRVDLICSTAGGGTDFMPCLWNGADCAIGYSCISTSSDRCHRYCWLGLPPGTNGCPIGGPAPSCLPFTPLVVLDGLQLGFCTQ